MAVFAVIERSLTLLRVVLAVLVRLIISDARCLRLILKQEIETPVAQLAWTAVKKVQPTLLE